MSRGIKSIDKTVLQGFVKQAISHNKYLEEKEMWEQKSRLYRKSRGRSKSRSRSRSRSLSQENQTKRKTSKKSNKEGKIFNKYPRYKILKSISNYILIIINRKKQIIKYPKSFHITPWVTLQQYMNVSIFTINIWPFS